MAMSDCSQLVSYKVIGGKLCCRAGGYSYYLMPNVYFPMSNYQLVPN